MAVALLLLVAVASRADAQVSCDDPDNLCTGDPCIIDNADVLPPCVVDFGSRTLIIHDRLSRTFSPDSSEVSLTAGAVIVESGAQVVATKLAATGPLDFRGHGSAITLEAGGLLTMSGSLDASSRCKYADCHAGIQRLHGAGGVVVTGPMLVKGYRAGTIDITSAAGDIAIEGPLNALGKDGGGTITLQAAGNVTLDGDVTTGRGGDIGITANGDVTVNGKVRGRAESSHVVLGAGGTLRVFERVTVIDRGTIDLSASTLVQLAPGSLVDATGRPGGSIRVKGADVAAQGRIRAKGKPEQGLYGDAGEIRLTALSGDLVLAGDVYAKGKSFGCTFEAQAAQDLTVSSRIVCAGTAAFVGCIALSAGGTLDTTGATFDLPVVADCPGSPSGAFL